MIGTILGILWLVLKIILWILLGILLLILLIVLMVLFVPIRYQLAGSKYKSIQGRGKVTYLLRLIRAQFYYSPEGYAYKVKVLFFTILSEEVSTKQAETTDEVEAEVPVEGPMKKPEDLSDQEIVEEVGTEDQVLEASIEETSTQTTVQPKEEQVAKPAEETHIEASVDKNKADKKAPQEKQEKTKKQKTKKSKKQEDQEGESAKEKALRFYGCLRQEANVGVLRFILRRLFKAVGSVLPRRFNGKLHFGLDDPAMTAYILGGASIFYPKYKDKLTITADFETPVIEGDVDVKGYILPCIFVWTIIRILLDGRVRRLIKEARKKV